MANRGQSLELFYIDGSADRMLTAEIFNWTGHVLMTPRIQLADALKRREAGYTGVYILIGDTEDSDLPKMYIGESEDVGERIRSHDTNKDWWTQAVLITSAANGLNKAHVKFIEYRLLEEARNAGRTILENGNKPSCPTLSEAAKANMEQFVDYVLSILPALRIDGFVAKTRVVRPPPDDGNVSAENQEVSFIFKLGDSSSRGIVDAIAHLRNGEFIVQPGSVGRAEWIGVEHNYQRLFSEVIESGVYVKDGAQRKFKKAYAFTSPSAAGAILSGRSTAGPLVWKLETNPKKDYKTWEGEQLRTTR